MEPIRAGGQDVSTVPLNERSRPWEQLPNETEYAFASFLAYLNLGPNRTVRAAFHTLDESGSIGCQIKMLYKHSTTFKWAYRAEAWDRKNLRIESKRIRKELKNTFLKTQRNRLKMRNAASDIATRTIGIIGKRNLETYDEKTLIDVLKITRDAYEIVGLSHIDHADQLQSVSVKATGREPTKAIEQSPEELFELSEESYTLQRSGAESEAVLESPNRDMPGTG
jgi:hypothetical protein